MGLGVLASTQLSHSSRFRHWHSSFGNNGYLHLRAAAILISCQPRLKKIIQNNLVSVAMNLSWNLQKISDLNDLKNGPAIKILYDNMKNKHLLFFALFSNLNF